MAAEPPTISREVTEQETSEHVRDALRRLVASVPPPMTGSHEPLPWRVLYADGKLAHDVIVLGSKLERSLSLDLRYLPLYRRTEAEWLGRSVRGVLRDRLIWVAEGNTETIRA